jgi:hypothetical protein
VRACPVDDKDAEMLLLKLAIKEALCAGTAVGYSSRLCVIPSDDKILIVRTSEPTKAIEVSRKRPADAVDRFIDAFVYESDADLNMILFYHSVDTTDTANSWGWVKSRSILGNLISHKPWLKAVV